MAKCIIYVPGESSGYLTKMICGHKESALYFNVKSMALVFPTVVSLAAFCGPAVLLHAQSLGVSQDQIKQNNLKAMQVMGGYVQPVVPPSDPVAFGEYMRQQHQQVQRETEIRLILREVAKTEERIPIETNAYTHAYHQLVGMLLGQSELSIKDAYYSIEAAYGEPYLTKEEYDGRIQQSAEFIKTWLLQNGYDIKNSDHLHLGIQQFMKNELFIEHKKPDGPSQKIKHAPFFYDYADFKGEKDFRNYFLTKALATGGGQCNSLPMVYLVLAEALGAKAYLSFAPQHSFVKYLGSDGKLHNYEPTSGYNISDAWYVDNMGISLEARKSGIYFDTLNTRQIVANGLIDLCFGYLQKNGIGNADFALNCLEVAQQQFPAQNNIYYYFMRSEIIGRMLYRALRHYTIPLEQADLYADTRQLRDELMKNEDRIMQLGYVPMNEATYQRLMEEHEFKGKLQQQQEISGKEKRELFIQTY